MPFNETYIHVVTSGGYNRGNNSLLLMRSGTNMAIHYRSETGTDTTGQGRALNPPNATLNEHFLSFIKRFTHPTFEVPVVWNQKPSFIQQ